MKKRKILLLSTIFAVVLSASMLFGCNSPTDPNDEQIPSVPVIDDNNNPSNPSQDQTSSNPTEDDSNSSDDNFSIMDGDNHIKIE
jgi:hypothetical protein